MVREAFLRLKQQFEELKDSSNVEEQTRGALFYLFNRIIEDGDALETSTIPLDPMRCPNCGAPCDLPKSPYCSERCRIVAAFVRQCRNSISTDAIFKADKQIGLGQAFWSVLGGGLPRRESLVPPATRRKVIERDGGICQLCGAEASLVENARGSCNRSINLRAVCLSCSHTRPFSEVTWIAQAPTVNFLRELATRVGAQPAIRGCDDAESWDWRAFLKERKTKL